MPAPERLQALNTNQDSPEAEAEEPAAEIPDADPVAAAALAADVPAALELLRSGELTVHGQLTDASNAVLYCSSTLNGVSALCVYKPVRGERPLWDFPDGTLAAARRRPMSWRRPPAGR